MTDTKNPAIRLPVLVLILAAITGAAGYFALNRNASTVAQAGQCSEALEMAQKLEDSIGGEVAAFSIAERPHLLSQIAFKKDGTQEQTLTDYSGKTLLVNLWATWCAPCRAEMPSLQQLNVEMGGDEFAVLPISVDLGSPEKPLKFYEEIGLSKLPFLHDDKAESFNALKKRSLALGLPATVILDKQGCVLGKLNGPAEWASEDAKRLVSKVIELQR